MGLNTDGVISYCAFIGVVLPFSLPGSESLCVAFSVLEHGKDVYIDGADLAAFFGHAKKSGTCQSVLAEVAPDGRLSRLSFLRQMVGDLLS